MDGLIGRNTNLNTFVDDGIASLIEEDIPTLIPDGRLDGPIGKLSFI